MNTPVVSSVRDGLRTSISFSIRGADSPDVVSGDEHDGSECISLLVRDGVGKDEAIADGRTNASCLWRAGDSGAVPEGDNQFVPGWIKLEFIQQCRLPRPSPAPDGFYALVQTVKNSESEGEGNEFRQHRLLSRG